MLHQWKKAEVFTPAWLCNLMNNHCDEDWFGRSDVFNVENEQLDFLGMLGLKSENDDKPETVICKIFDWRRKNSLLFKNINWRKTDPASGQDGKIWNTPFVKYDGQ